MDRSAISPSKAAFARQIALESDPHRGDCRQLAQERISPASLITSTWLDELADGLAEHGWLATDISGHLGAGLLVPSG